MQDANFFEMFRKSGMPGDFYVERTDHNNLEAQLSIMLTTGPVVVYGESKNGKTSLIEHVLARKSLTKDRDYIDISCHSDMSMETLYRELYQAIGIRGDSSVTTGSSISSGGGISLLGSLGLSLFGKGQKNQSQTSKQNLSFDPNAVAAALTEAGVKYVKIENIHYAKPKFRESFAQHLRVFLDKQIKFVIIGVGTEETDLLKFNPDLRDRLKTLEVPPMSRDLTEKLIRHMARIINLEVYDAGINAIRNECDRKPLKIISFFRAVCEEMKIDRPLPQTRSLSNDNIKKWLKQYKNSL